MKTEKSLVTLTYIDLEGISIEQRVRLIRKLFFLPYKHVRELRAEFKDWKYADVLDTKRKQMLYILDHFIFWSYNVLFAVLTGKHEGISWKYQIAI